MQDEPQLIEKREIITTPPSEGGRSEPPSWPNLLVGVPIALAILGICYDVGYFIRIGFDLFPLFSLSEHFVFAMQGVPDLLWFVAALLISAAVAYTLSSRASAKPSAPTTQVPRSPEEELKSLFLSLWIGMLIGSAISTFTFRPNSWWFFLTQVVLVGLWFWLIVAAPRSAQRMMVFGGLTLGTVLLACGIGYLKADAPEEGWAWSINPATILLKNGPSMSGRVLRSGERGLLISNSLDGTVQFKPWEDIRGIELDKAKPKPWWRALLWWTVWG